MLSLRTLAVTFSLALLSATAMALPAPAAPCHGESAQVMGETREQAAGLARNLVKNTGVGTLMSIMNSSQKSAVEGYPFGSMDYYVDDCQDGGKPLMLLSHLQINVQNARSSNHISLAIRKLPGPNEHGNPMVDPRVTLMGRLVPVEEAKQKKAEECFVAKHPEAKWWLPGAGFHDFKWYNLDIEEIYYIGGFGGIHYIGWIPVDTYYNADLSNSVKSARDTVEEESESLGLMFRQQTMFA
ncbi:MAG: pyridoxamine 5'-phosphate oxidase-domain-containing protein [Linnemannia elongata]|nr:MAG: pyridoxamine 5'-phosphate oxidase-domain-containing protein [Linnemannia elongata]